MRALTFFGDECPTLSVHAVDAKLNFEAGTTLRLIKLGRVKSLVVNGLTHIPRAEFRRLAQEQRK